MIAMAKPGADFGDDGFCSESTAWLAFGLFRRMAIMAGALALGLALGKPGVIGAATGIGAGFLVVVTLKVRRKV
jgi:hypothetical protein